LVYFKPIINIPKFIKLASFYDRVSLTLSQLLDILKTYNN